MALSLSDNSKFFGLDISQAPRQWRSAFEMLMAWPALRALTPAVPVRLLHIDGQVRSWWWANGALTPAEGVFPAQSIWAVEMPEDAVLEQVLTLPPLSAVDVAEAVALEAASITPFGVAQTVSGFAREPVARKSRGAAAPETQKVHMALTSQAQIAQQVQRAEAVHGVSAESVEVWVLPSSRGSDGGNQGVLLFPIVFSTPATNRRAQIVRKGRLRRLGLVALAAVLLAALAATPVLQARERALTAQNALARLNADAAPQLAQREQLVKQAEALRVVQGMLETQLAPLPVLDLVTRTLPDSAWLISLRVEGDKVVLTGHADDAAALVQQLSAAPGVQDVRLPTPATRPTAADKERFTIELKLDPKRYGLASAKEGNA